MDGHQRAVHPVDFLPLAGSVLVLAASFINFVWVQESTQADREMDWRSRLRRRGRRHPVLTKVQYACLLLALLFYATYGVTLVSWISPALARLGICSDRQTLAGPTLH
jgi:hypothetical protein